MSEVNEVTQSSEMSAEDRKIVLLTLFLLFAQAYYKMLESALNCQVYILDLELNESYFWVIRNITDILRINEELSDFPMTFEPILHDLYPSNIRDIDWDDMVAPEADSFLSNVQQYVYSKGIYQPEEHSSAWIVIELFRPDIVAAVKKANDFKKRMQQAFQQILDSYSSAHSDTGGKMFNLIVSGIESAWDTAQPWTMMADRFNEFSGKSIEVKAISMSDIQSLNKLEDVPTLIMYEWDIGAANGSIVRFGYLQNIRMIGQTISFNFREEAHADQGLVDEYAVELQLDDWERARTHWAIKDGEIPQKMIEQMVPGNFKKFRYDVVLSYACEDNEYVEKVAKFLKVRGVELFYAPFKEADLWGRDMTEELDIIYRREGRYCVMFVSKNYAKKAWPTYEKRSAMSRAVQQRDRYILPCRFDDTEVPGMQPSISYIDLNNKTPDELGVLIIKVLGRRRK